MFVPSAVLALTLLGGAVSPPARAPFVTQAACITPVETGTFRVLATKADKSAARPTMLVLENIAGCLEATLITDDRAPSAIDQLTIVGDTLRGSIRTDAGLAKVELRLSSTTVEGSILDGRQTWMLAGRKTS